MFALKLRNDHTFIRRETFKIIFEIYSSRARIQNRAARKSTHQGQKLQNRAARIVTNSPYDASALPLIKQLGWLNIQQMIEFETTKIVHKTLHNEVPEYLQCLFTRVSDKCVRELRNSKLDLNLPLLKTSFGQKSFSFRGAKLWNKFGSEAKITSSFSAFKKAFTQN